MDKVKVQQLLEMTLEEKIQIKDQILNNEMFDKMSKYGYITYVYYEGERGYYSLTEYQQYLLLMILFPEKTLEQPLQHENMRFAKRFGGEDFDNRTNPILAKIIYYTMVETGRFCGKLTFEFIKSKYRDYICRNLYDSPYGEEESIYFNQSKYTEETVKKITYSDKSSDEKIALIKEVYETKYDNVRVRLPEVSNVLQQLETEEQAKKDALNTKLPSELSDIVCKF